jgi:hypothetical protein
LILFEVVEMIVKAPMAQDVHWHCEGVVCLGSHPADLKAGDGDGMVRDDLVTVMALMPADNARLGSHPVKIFFVLISRHSPIVTPLT